MALAAAVVVELGGGVASVLPAVAALPSAAPTF